MTGILTDSFQSLEGTTFNEVWKDIPGYEGLYQVSNTGVVRSINRVTTGNRKRNISGKTLKQKQNTFGYLIVGLCKDGKSKTERVHRLVAKAFLPADSNRPYINHKDGNPQNNHISNPEWCTQKENVQHAYDTGLRKPHKLLTEEQISYIKAVYVPYSREFGTGALARKFGVDQGVIWRYIYGRNKNYLD